MTKEEIDTAIETMTAEWNEKADEPRLYIPPYMRPALFSFLTHGRRPGDFLFSLLSNDLRLAVSHADDTNGNLLCEYCRFLYNNAPTGSWGSLKKVEAWIKCGGFVGDLTRAAEEASKPVPLEEGAAVEVLGEKTGRWHSGRLLSPTEDGGWFVQIESTGMAGPFDNEHIRIDPNLG